MRLSAKSRRNAVLIVLTFVVLGTCTEGREPLAQWSQAQTEHAKFTALPKALLFVERETHALRNVLCARTAHPTNSSRRLDLRALEG